MTSVDRTAYPRFGRVISARELVEAFTPSAAEMEWARGRTQDPQHLLALVVWLKSYQRLGYFPKLSEVPEAVTRHVRGLLELAEDVELERAAARSAKRHRQFVRDRLQVVYEPARVRRIAEEAIRKAVQTKDNPADLINVALEELVRARCGLPGYTTLDTMTASIRTEVNNAFFATVAARLDPAARARLGRLLLVDPVSRRSEFDRLKDVAKAASLNRFKERLALLADIDAIGPTEVWLADVPPGKIAHFAGEARVTDVADLRKVTAEDKRLTLIVSLVHTVRTGVRDDVVTMFCKRMATIHKKGRDHLEALREAHRAESERLLEGGRPVLRRRKGAERRPEALTLEAAIHDRLPQRALLDILTRTAYLLGWHHHFGPASGSDPKIRDAMARYVLTAFAHGTLLGPTQVAAHMRGQVSVHELTLAGNKHTTATKIDKASATVINAFNRLDVAGVGGDGRVAAADGSQIDTWENNLLAETSIRYGGYGGIAYRHVSNTYIALFSHFIPCGVWEAVYIIEGLLKNTSDIQPDTVHADTQGQSLPVFGLGALLGFDLLPRIRNWHDLVFYRPDEQTRYHHIDTLFGEDAVDWDLIETHWSDLLRTAISIRENKLSSVTLLRRLGNHSRKNRLYRAFRELGRAVRTITLLRYLSEPELREQITAITNRNEAFHGFADWLMFGGKLIGHNDPDHQEKVIKFNELLANCVI